MSFQVGDMVECLSHSRYDDQELLPGHSYEITGSGNGTVTVKGMTVWWYAHRFKLIQTAPAITKVVKRVRCKNPRQSLTLVKNHIYEVEKEILIDDQLKYRLVGLVNPMSLSGAWYAWDFEVVEDTCPPTLRSGATNISDWRVWRDHGLQSGHCVCRMPKQLCTYHKEG